MTPASQNWDCDRDADGIRAAQREWATRPVPERLRYVLRLRHLLVKHSQDLARATAEVRRVEAAEVITSEILPLAESCRFLENEAAEILAPRRPGIVGRPLWLTGVKTEIRREPHGIVLILAPSNYPLFLAGTQLLQALVAGNAVLLKPAPAAAEPLFMLLQLLDKAGFPRQLAKLVPEDPQHAHELIRTHAVDKVILTAGSAAGRAVLHSCAEAIIPATVELSGVDSFHVLADADPIRAADVLLFALAMNRGRTCIAPRRILVQQGVAGRLRLALRDRFRSRRAAIEDLPSWVRDEVNAALQSGAQVVAGDWPADAAVPFRYPLILEKVPASSRLRTDDHFSPLAVLDEVKDEEEAICTERACPYALGASVFTRDQGRANAFASRLAAGSITANDTAIPTADPRLPFGGRKRSGFGVTRGPEGLLEMTAPQVISWRSPTAWLPHLDAPAPGDEERFHHLLNLLHGQGFLSRLTSLRFLLTRRRRNQSTNNSKHG